MEFICGVLGLVCLMGVASGHPVLGFIGACICTVAILVMKGSTLTWRPASTLPRPTPNSGPRCIP
jgi:hypothetical protein